MLVDFCNQFRQAFKIEAYTNEKFLKYILKTLTFCGIFKMMIKNDKKATVYKNLAVV